jgi:uncharacterized membrane protein
MSEYSPVVEKIVSDYLARLAVHLRAVPSAEHQEITREIQSHIYESYQGETEGDEVDRILSVLRKLGEPSTVASTRIPHSMMAIGKRKKLPLYISGGVAALLFGIPLGLGGVGVLIGLFVSVLALLVAFCAVGVGFVISGLVCMAMGMLMIFYPEFVSKLLMMGYIQLDWGAAGLNQIPLGYQGILIVIAGLILAAVGLGILWLGKHSFRGIRYLTTMVWQKIREYLERRKIGSLRTA